MLMLVSAASLWLADRIFIAYERKQLVPQMPDIGQGMDKDQQVNLSALRYNDGTVNRGKAQGEFRILSFGDSFTYSVVKPEWSYNGIIQSRLQAGFPDRNFRVVNLGEPATGTRHFREAYNYWSQVFEHDAVLFHIFLGNDILDDAYIHASVVWAPNEAIFRGDNPVLEAGNRRVPKKFPLRMMDYAWAWWLSARTSSGDLPEGYNWAGLTSLDEETFRRVNFRFMENFDPRKMDQLLAGYEQVALLLQRAQEISESGTPVMVVLGPAEPQVDNTVRAEALAQAGDDAALYDLALAQRIIGRLQQRLAPDVSLLDLSWVFRQAREETGEKLYFRRNTHWDRAGNELAGEQIARQIGADWLESGESFEPLPEWVYTPRVSDAEIDAYITPLTGVDSDLPVISGAVRAVQMMDGISGQADNWAIAPLGQEVLLDFASPRHLSSMQLHLFDSDGRKYRFTVEALRDGEWQMVANHSETAVGGKREIQLGKDAVSAIRIVGLHNSMQDSNPENAFLHIEEISFHENRK